MVQRWTTIQKRHRRTQESHPEPASKILWMVYREEGYDWSADGVILQTGICAPHGQFFSISRNMLPNDAANEALAKVLFRATGSHKGWRGMEVKVYSDWIEFDVFGGYRESRALIPK